MSKVQSAAALPAEEADSSYVFSEQVGHLLRRAYQRHMAIFQQLIPDSELTVAQFVVLCAVRDSGSCSLIDVVKSTAIDQATTRGIVKRLSARELLVVEHDPDDRRRVLLSLTPAGATLVAAMVPFAQQITEATLAGLNAAERVAVVFLLKKMAAEGDGVESQ